MDGSEEVEWRRGGPARTERSSIALVLAAWATEPAGGWLGESGGGLEAVAAAAFLAQLRSCCSCCSNSSRRLCWCCILPISFHHLLLLLCLSPPLPLLSSSDPFASASSLLQHTAQQCASPSRVLSPPFSASFPSLSRKKEKEVEEEERREVDWGLATVPVCGSGSPGQAD